MATMTPDPTTQLRVVLFRNGGKAFRSLLRQHEIDYVDEPVQLGVPMASGEAIYLAAAVAMAPSFAKVLIEWLRGRTTRKITVRQGLSSVEIEGTYSVDQVERILDKALSAGQTTAVVIQTDKDDA